MILQGILLDETFLRGRPEVNNLQDYLRMQRIQISPCSFITLNNQVLISVSTSLWMFYFIQMFKLFSYVIVLDPLVFSNLHDILHTKFSSQGGIVFLGLRIETQVKNLL